MTTTPPIETAMVFGAGLGTRMRPVSWTLPKPAVPVLDRPLIGWGLALAAAAGARRIVVNTHHLDDEMEEAARRCVPDGVELSFSREPELMGSAGGVATAVSRGLLAGSGPIMVVNGDVMVELDVGPLLERFHGAGDLVTLGLLPHPDPERWSSIRLDEDGRVERILPKGSDEAGESPYLYTGVMVADREAIERLPIEVEDLPKALWMPAKERGRLGGAVLTGTWFEVGYPHDLLAASLEALSGRDRWVADDARVAEDAVLRRSVVGRDGRIESGAEVVESVVAEGARVGAGARVERSVVFGAATVEPGERLVDDVRAPVPEDHRD